MRTPDMRAFSLVFILLQDFSTGDLRLMLELVYLDIWSEALMLNISLLVWR